MFKVSTALAATLCAATLGGCAAFGGAARSPDEFAVTRNAPLVIPPDFHLTPPVAGTAGLTAGDAQQQAVDALFGPPAPRSAGETALLDAAGRGDAQIGIRTVVQSPSTRLVDKGAATLTILNAPQADSEIASVQIGQ
jgi:hypothetical protein